MAHFHRWGVKNDGGAEARGQKSDQDSQIHVCSDDQVSLQYVTQLALSSCTQQLLVIGLHNVLSTGHITESKNNRLEETLRIIWFNLS